MRIDKVSDYWTKEARDRLWDITNRQTAILNDVDTLTRDEDPDFDPLNEWHELEREADEIKESIEARYIKARKKTGLLADVAEIVNALEKEDYQARAELQLKQIDALRQEGADEESLAILKKMSVENFENCRFFVLTHIRVQLNGLDGDEPKMDKALSIVDKRVSEWYVNEDPALLPMAHGKATDALAYMNTKRVTWNDNGDASIDRFGVQLSIVNLQNLRATLGVNTDKLLSTALAQFTKQNDFRRSGGQTPKREVSIPFIEYAKKLGYDVEVHKTSTPEEAEKEKKRAKNQLDNARKVVRKDLDIIHACTLTWEEQIKGKARDFARVSIVTFTALKNGNIILHFSPELASYLAERNLITQYPTSLLAIPATKPNAYRIGKKLYEHYNIDSNQIKGTNDKISVLKLLEVTDLPSYEEVMKQDRHWDRRIKEPLETALDVLTKEGLLKDWEYTHAKGIELTDEEASNITIYADFEKLYIHFVPADKVDHTDRIKAKKETLERKRKAKKSKAEKKS